MLWMQSWNANQLMSIGPNCLIFYVRVNLQ
jgi:hypothetical protein